MQDKNDIFSGFPNNNDMPECPTNQEFLMEEELRRAYKQLKRAKKKGKSGKKAKKKLKHLKKQRDKLNKLLYTAKYQPPRGRWDGLIEKSAPEVFKLANTFIDRLLPPKERCQ